MYQAINSEAKLSVQAQTSDASNLLELVEMHDPDVAVVSLDCPGMSGLGLLAALRAGHPDLKVLALSRRDESHILSKVLRAGATGYLSKLASAGDLVSSVKNMLAGEIAISDKAADRLLDELFSGTSAASQANVDLLSRREMEVLELTGWGMNRGDIARKLNLSDRTIDSYRARMKEKLGIGSMPELIRYAVNWVENGCESLLGEQ